jgi:hypothetical protein
MAASPPHTTLDNQRSFYSVLIVKIEVYTNATKDTQRTI